MRKYLAQINWNNTLENKTAKECWDILKSDIDCIVDKCVPLKKTGETVKKETFIEIHYKNQVQANDVEDI